MKFKRIKNESPSTYECDRCGRPTHDDTLVCIGDQYLCPNCASGFWNEARKKSDNWMGVPGAKFIYHGDWADPEIVYNGFSINYYDVEQGFIDVYREEHPEDKNDEGFDDWLRQQGSTWIQGCLDDSVYAYYGDQIEKAKPFAGIKGAFLLKDIKTEEPFVMYNDKRLELSDVAAQGGYDLDIWEDEEQFNKVVSSSRKRKDV